ncbi:arginine--tRNA ligase [Clostridium thermarum]|uniref:arginine--tRNA ligase n=1 Tax=Clostridium thermarum TaxID=1716543 RepID=UPI0013D65ED5|nr:arginine--tRNA ligase [Clostridium thermarum]
MDYKKLISEGISLHTSIVSTALEPLIEIPPRSEMGDFSFPCFHISKLLKKNPCSIANELKTKLKLKAFNKIDAVGPYLNFYIDTVLFIKNTIEKVLSERDSYGSSMLGNGRTVVVDFSSPSLAETFKLNHLLAALIGNSLTKIYSFAGYNCVTKSSFDDISNAFGKLMVAYKRGWIDEKVLFAKPSCELQRAYIKFHDEVEMHPSLLEKAKEHYIRLEEGQEPELSLFNKLKTLSLLEYSKIYEMLNLKIDSFDKGNLDSNNLKEVIKKLADKNLLNEIAYAKVVLLKEYNLPPCIIKRSDGAIASTLRDLVEISFREKVYDLHRNIYVSDNSKALYYNQLFTTLRLLNSPSCDSCVHVGFGSVKFLDKELSVKKEDPDFIEYILKQAVEDIFEKFKEYAFGNKAETAKKMGIGAVIFAHLYNNRKKDIPIGWKELLSFEGDTGPFVQCTYFRGRTIAKKAYYISCSEDYKRLITEEELELVKLLSYFPEMIVESLNNLDPSVVAGYVLKLARKLDCFLNLYNVVELKDEQLKMARFKLIEAACQVLENGLHLLGIEIFEKN